MIVKGIKGAITVESNTEEALKSATLELLSALTVKNNITPEKISHAIFTLTDDINAAFPAKFARKDYGWSNVAMMCFHELDVPAAVKRCLRIRVVGNCEDSFVPEFVYLKGAQNLRA